MFYLFVVNFIAIKKITFKGDSSIFTDFVL